MYLIKIEMQLTETVIFLKNEANKKLWLFISSIICYFNDLSSNFRTAYFLTLFSFFLTCSYSAFSGLSVRPSPLFVIIYLSLLIYLFSLSSSSMYISRDSLCFRCYVSVLRTVCSINSVLNRRCSINICPLMNRPMMGFFLLVIHPCVTLSKF